MILKPMEPVLLDAALLRARAPELVLRPGMSLAARVAERHGRHGLLMLAGAALSARLPDEVPAGAKLRLVVQEAGPERVVLRIADAPPQAAPGLAVPLPLPDGRSAHVRVEEREGRTGGEGGDEGRLVLVYESPALGAMELGLTLDRGGIGAAVRVAAGAALELAREEAEALREALGAAAGRPATVTIAPRRDPLDVYA